MYHINKILILGRLINQIPEIHWCFIVSHKLSFKISISLLGQLSLFPVFFLTFISMACSATSLTKVTTEVFFI